MIAGLQEDDDGTQDDEAKTMEWSTSSETPWCGGDVRTEWLGCRRDAGVDRGVDLLREKKNGEHR